MRVNRLGAWSMGPVLTVASLAAAGANLSLVDATKQGDRAAVRALLHEHADPNAAELDGTTALHWAVQHDDIETVDLLLAAGANVNASNRYGVTPLMAACTNGNATIVEKLLAAGGDPHAAGPEGGAALKDGGRTGKGGRCKAVSGTRGPGAQAGTWARA